MKEETLISRKKILLILGITAGVYIFLKYLLPLVVPFLLALILSRVMSPVVKWLQRKYKIKPVIGASLIMLLGGMILFFIVKYLGSMLMEQIQKLSLYLPFYTKKITIFLKESCSRIEDGMNMERGIIYPALEKQGENMAGKIVAYFGEYSLVTFRMLLDAFIFIVLMIMSTILLTAREIKCNESKILKLGRDIYEQVSIACLSYAKAQLVIMVFDAILAAIGLYILGNPYYLVIGIFLGVIDALPLFGTGTVLIPWAIISIFLGNPTTGIGLLILYGILAVMRQIVEPKIMGKQMNMDLLTSLFFMYVGYRLFGIWGFVLGPIGFCTGKSIYENFLRLQHE
ncbi:MAG: AI-2E family transporter [Lachnospiraceae bacterium]|nr:AI-2E family transporter [Lachnospiraceae bacterium]